MNTEITYSYELINTIEELEALRPQWAELFSKKEKPSLFLHWDWLILWWKSFSQPNDRLAVVLVERAGEPFALAPFFVRCCRYYGLSRRMLKFIGEGNSDRADILCNDTDVAFYDGLFAFLQEWIAWDVVSLREIPGESKLLAWASNTKMTHFEKDSDCPYINLESGLTVEQFRSTLSRNLRREFSNMTNRLKKLGDYRFYHMQLKDSEDPILRQLSVLEQNSAKATRDINLVLSPKENFIFQQRLLRQFDESICPLLTVLEINGEIAAYLYGFIFDGTYHAYNMAFLPEYYRLSPGKLIMQETIDESIRRGLKEFDFLRGNSYIKSKWSKTARSQVHLTLFRKDYINYFHSFLIFNVRPYVKLILHKINTKFSFIKGK